MAQFAQERCRSGCTQQLPLQATYIVMQELLKKAQTKDATTVDSVPSRQTATGHRNLWRGKGASQQAPFHAPPRPFMVGGGSRGRRTLCGVECRRNTF
jgi:hypothetical protein